MLEIEMVDKKELNAGLRRKDRELKMVGGEGSLNKQHTEESVARDDGTLAPRLQQQRLNEYLVLPSSMSEYRRRPS